MNQAKAKSAVALKWPGLSALTVTTSVAIAAISIAGCTSRVDYDDPVFNAGDPAVTCQPGQVGWDFGTGLSGEGTLRPVKAVSAKCVDGSNEATFMTACQNTLSCEFTPSCREFTVKYTCGDEPAQFSNTYAVNERTVDGMLQRDRVEFACPLPLARAANGSGDGTTFHERFTTETVALSGKACIPASCPEDTIRDAKMQCVPVQKATADAVFGPPYMISLVKTTAVDLGRDPLIPGVPYQLEQTYKGTVRGRVMFWLTDQWVKVDAQGRALEYAQGFRCSVGATYLTGNEPTNRFGVRGATLRTNLPDDCANEGAADRAKKDLARRLGINVENLAGERWEFRRVTLHSSYDMEGNYRLSQGMQQWLPDDTCQCAPNPTGFYYHPRPDAANSYIDFVRYYQQREIAYHNDNPAPFEIADRAAWLEPSRLNRPGSRVTDTEAPRPTRLSFGTEYLRAETQQLRVRVNSRALGAVKVSLGWTTVGDTAANPYSFASNSSYTLRNSVTARVYAASAHPSAGLSTAMYVGEIPLTNATATSAVATGTVTLPRTMMASIRSAPTFWPGLRLYYCINLKGKAQSVWIDQQNFPHLIMDDYAAVTDQGVAYKAGVAYRTGDSGCRVADTVVAIVRDESSSPLAPTPPSPDTTLGAAQNNGNNDTQGEQNDSSESTCVGATCSSSGKHDMATSGALGRSIFASDDTNQDNTDAGTASGDSSAEALGFSIIDESDSKFDLSWDKTDITQASENVEVTIDIGTVIDNLSDLLKPTTPISVEVDQGKFGGREGIGVAFGYKTLFLLGPIPGQLKISVGAGVSIGLGLEVLWVPEEEKEYPCKAADTGGANCLFIGSAAANQNDARKSCMVSGGRLAEMRSDDDFDAMTASLASSSEQALWIGGQVAYQFASPSCNGHTPGTPEHDGCVRQAALTYRYLSDDSDFATGTGLGTPTPTSSVLAQSDFNMSGLALPSALGLALGKTSGGGAQIIAKRSDTDMLKPLCQWLPAASEDYTKITGKVNVGIGAGAAVEACIPNDKIGICILGGLRFLDFSVTFAGGSEKWEITTPSGTQLEMGTKFVEAPYNMTLLAVGIYLEIRLFLFSVTKSLISFDGFKIAEGKLFREDFPYMELQ